MCDVGNGRERDSAERRALATAVDPRNGGPCSVKVRHFGASADREMGRCR